MIERLRAAMIPQDDPARDADSAQGRSDAIEARLQV